VWLDALSDGTARAGDLCTRHADSLAPPNGWERVDRRPRPPAPVDAQPVVPPVAATAAPATSAPAGSITVTPLAKETKPKRKSGDDDLLPARRRPARRRRWSEVPTLFEGATDTETAEPEPSVAPETVAPAPEPVSAPVVETVDEPAAGQDAADSTPASWLPRNASDDDLDGVLDASTPLLARAFRNAKPANSDADDE
jgi:hypothetical protein